MFTPMQLVYFDIWKWNILYPQTTQIFIRYFYHIDKDYQ